VGPSSSFDAQTLQISGGQFHLAGIRGVDDQPDQVYHNDGFGENLEEVQNYGTEENEVDHQLQPLENFETPVNVPNNTVLGSNTIENPLSLSSDGVQFTLDYRLLLRTGMSEEVYEKYFRDTSFAKQLGYCPSSWKTWKSHFNTLTKNVIEVCFYSLVLVQEVTKIFSYHLCK
jgi:hypothetical protein